MMVCHAKWTQSRLGFDIAHAFDVMNYLPLHAQRAFLPLLKGFTMRLA